MSNSTSSTTTSNAKLIILFETNIARDELRVINSLFTDPRVNVCAADDRLMSSNLQDLKYNIILADVREDDVKQWIQDQKSWIVQNSDTVKCVYKHKSGTTVPADDVTTLKKSFGCCAVRKYLPDSARDFPTYMMKVCNDHVSSKVVKLSFIEKVMKLIASLICA